ncbi:MAG: hypothetical protein KC549_10590, partial [Myxococcales bacterium]|nr:hypothetical protein [Myxococcales bacterium]
EGVSHATVRETLEPESELPTWRALCSLRLIGDNNGRVELLGALRRAEIGVSAPGLLRRVASRLLAGVNQIDSLEPTQAECVFQAHALYLALGDAHQAARLACLHVGGLVELARRLSLEERFAEAQLLYERTERVLDQLTGHNGLPRVRSYVVHYATYNGRRAETLDPGGALRGYREATRLWPDNALWHGRYIAALAELGRDQEAHEALATAEQAVPAHPRRATTLYVKPAWAAIHGGLGAFGLELVDRLSRTIDDSQYPDVYGMRLLAALDQRWSSGVVVRSVPHNAGRLVFMQPTQVQVGLVGKSWLASVAQDFRARADGRLKALQAVGQAMCERIRFLLAAGYGLLTDADIQQKSRLISLVDMLNSDLGFPHRGHRWLIGRLHEGKFISVEGDAIELGVDPPVGGDGVGLWFGRVPVYRDGQPSGPVADLRVAGSGRSIWELLDHLRELPVDEGTVGHG